MIGPKFYNGNNPNSYEYDPSIPIGWNKWDAQEVDEANERDEDIEDDEPENEDE